MKLFAKRLSASGSVTRLIAASGLNMALSVAIASRVWIAGASLISLHFIIANLSPSAQGYYFTFNSLSQLTQFVDLGLQILMIQFASHEAVHLSFGPRGQVMGSADAISRLSSLGRFSLAWYGAGLLMLVPALIGAGEWMFGGRADGIRWEAPWLAVCFLVGLDLCATNFMWILEGTNQLVFVYTHRLVRGIVNAVALWLLLTNGFELWSIPLSLAAAICTTVLFLVIGRPKFLRLFVQRPAAAVISWRHEILPVQWRLAISTLAGFVTYNLPVPVTFRFAGATVAGQLGLTWALVDAMTAIALLWPAVRFPTMGRAAAQRQWRELDRITVHVGVQALALTLLGAAAIVGLAFLAKALNLTLADRLLPLLPLVILAVSAVPKTIQSTLIYYLRAHRQEPIAGLTSATAPVMIGAVVAGAWLDGALGVASAYLFVMLFVWLPGTAWITWKCRRLWHQEAAPVATVSTVVQTP
ncbi:MAG: hypothetical protein WDN08_21720 [Rhizomicrobium sp.]